MDAGRSLQASGNYRVRQQASAPACLELVGLPIHVAFGFGVGTRGKEPSHAAKTKACTHMESRGTAPLRGRLSELGVVGGLFLPPGGALGQRKSPHPTPPFGNEGTHTARPP